ncbi:MAG: hypothetical protein SVM86_07190 [Candidatus Cloacimonadota bacterium]|nr:hypothetical protein [Candidatus Cloacimonadota bacterium]
MKNLLLILLLSVLLVACSTEGDFKVVNQTNHVVYFNIDDEDYIVDSLQTKTVSLDTGDKFIFFGDDEKTYTLEIEGETFALPNGETETQVTIRNGKTYKAYCTPTHAGVKVINNSGKDIINLFFYTSFDETLNTLTNSIENGETFYSRLEYATSENDFYYTFKVRYDDFSEEYFGGPEETTLGLDEQYVIELYEP